MIKPMLARVYDGKLPPGEWFVEPKLDGIRAIWDGHSFYSRSGRLLRNPVDVAAQLREQLPHTKLDGELFAEDWGSTQSAVKGSIPTHGEVTYFAFDILSLYNEELTMKTWSYRHQVLLTQLRLCNPLQAQVLDSVPLGTRDLGIVTEEYIKRGFEGIMLKLSTAPYQPGKRSKGWLKVKFVEEIDALIIGVQEGTGRLEGTLGSLTIKTAEGEQFGVGTGLSDDERGRLWKKHLEGELTGLTVTLQYQKDEKIVGRFPSYIRLRDE
jgi:DNA ligase-1